MSNSRDSRLASWMYRGIWGMLVSAFKVPDEPPSLPVRAGGQIEQFRPAPNYLRYLKLYFWIVLLIIDLVILALWVLVFVNVWWLGLLLAIPFLALAILPDIFAYIAMHLRYDTMWYVLTDRSLRIRRGIWTIQETTITFENVQNVSIKQGPVQRLFGISSIHVETAGGGGGAEPGKAGTNLGVIEGITDAQRIRDLVMSKVRASRSAGLGDDRNEPDRDTGAAWQWTPAHIDELRAIRDLLQSRPRSHPDLVT